jgi:hypothetical protein
MPVLKENNMLDELKELYIAICKYKYTVACVKFKRHYRIRLVNNPTYQSDGKPYVLNKYTYLPEVARTSTMLVVFWGHS